MKLEEINKKELVLINSLLSYYHNDYKNQNFWDFLNLVINDKDFLFKIDKIITEITGKSNILDLYIKQIKPCILITKEIDTNDNSKN
jgi:hypothetical protein